MNGIPFWMVEMACRNARAVVVSGLVNMERRSINGDLLPMINLQDQSNTFHLEVSGVWVKLDMSGVEVKSYDCGGGTHSLILIFREGVTVQLDFTTI